MADLKHEVGAMDETLREVLSLWMADPCDEDTLDGALGVAKLRWADVQKAAEWALARIAEQKAEWEELSRWHTEATTKCDDLTQKVRRLEKALAGEKQDHENDVKQDEERIHEIEGEAMLLREQLQAHEVASDLAHDSAREADAKAASGPNRD